MRIKNVKGAQERILESPYIIQNELEYRGHFHTLFGNEHPIHVEIGMGKGDFIIGNAYQYPNINFIGIERYDNVIVRAVDKLHDKELPNLKLIRMNADTIDQVFDHEIDTIYLNFSDPWPKARHAPRRLTSPTFLKKYDSVYQTKKVIIMKTDHRHLFEYSVMALCHHGYQFSSLSCNLHDDAKGDNIETEYESKFGVNGNPIYYLKAVFGQSVDS